MALTLLDSLAYFTATVPLSMLYPPPVSLVAISPKRWRCATGDHRWHTSVVKARICAFVALPMVHIGVGDSR